MRDVILAKVGDEVKMSQADEGPLQEPLLGGNLGRQGDRHPRLGLGRRDGATARRRSTSSTPTSNRSTRRRSCRASAPSRRPNWWRPDGPATSTLPMILVGDINSDTKTAVQPGDGQAYETLVKARDARTQHLRTARLLPRHRAAAGRRRRRRLASSTTRSTTS